MVTFSLHFNLFLFLIIYQSLKSVESQENENLPAK